MEETRVESLEETHEGSRNESLKYFWRSSWNNLDENPFENWEESLKEFKVEVIRK